jgi:hypothetical protein
VRLVDLTSHFTTVRICERRHRAEVTHHNHQTKNLQAKGDINPKRIKTNAVFCTAEITAVYMIKYKVNREGNTDCNNL